MKRGSLALALLISIALSPFSSAAATVKAGATCSKQNQTSVVLTVKYTCIKSGKKLIWSNGASLALAKPTPAPSPKPTPTPTSGSGPAFLTAKNFSDALSNVKMDATQNIYKASPSFKISTFQFMIDTQERLFHFWSAQGVNFQKPITTYFFSELDKDWLLATDTPRSCIIDTWFTDDFKNQYDGRTCQTSDKRTIILFPTGSLFINQTDNFRRSGIESSAHEIEHAVQNEVFNFDMPDPCWFREGLTTYTVWVTTSYENTFSSMSRLKASTFDFLETSLKKSNLIINGRDFQSWTFEDWLEVLNYQPSNPVCWGRNADGTFLSSPVFFGYSAGPFIVEKLYMDFGISKSVEFMKTAGTTKNFQTAFTQVLGRDYRDWMLKSAIPWLLLGGN
jgi:hypothetical protein